MSNRFDCFKTQVLHPRVKYFDSLGSTNTEAKSLLINGEREGLIVIARSQTAGRGRKGRTWLSPRGGLYFSLILKPRLGAKNAQLLGLLGACAVARSLTALSLRKVSLKWPNDVLVNTKKIAGILSETVSLGAETVGTVLGIGVNQNCPVSDMPPGLEWPTTSIIDELGVETSTRNLLCSIVDGIDELIQRVEHDTSYAAILDTWRELSSTLGSRVRIHEDDRAIDGIAKDIDSDGALIVQTEEGFVNVFSGDVSHLPPED